MELKPLLAQAILLFKQNWLFNVFTHLSREREREREESVCAVSYTHLDVYKRQI